MTSVLSSSSVSSASDHLNDGFSKEDDCGSTSSPNQQQYRKPIQNEPEVATAVSVTTTNIISPATTANAAASGSIPSRTPTDLTRLLVCAWGICAFYLVYGVLQERLFTVPAGDGGGGSPGKRLGPTVCLVTACVTNVLVALAWRMKLQLFEATSGADKGDQEGRVGGSSVSTTSPLDHRLLLVTSGCYVLSMTCSNEAVPIVSYPMAVLAKSCKLVPTIVVGSFSRTYPRSQWVAAFLITAGILLFQHTRIRETSTAAKVEESHQRTTTFGMLLLWTSLMFDGVLGLCQDRLKASKPQRRPPTANETMLYTNAYALLYLLPLAYVQNQIDLALIHQHWTSIVAINLAAAGGQVFIFLCLAWFSPIVTTTITTTRKFLTLLVSIWAFGHTFSMIQWLSVAVVFVGLYLAIFVGEEQRTTQVTKIKDKVE